MKKDYLFHQSRLRSSNVPPSWNEMWKVIRNSDGMTHRLKDYEYDAERSGKQIDIDDIIAEEERIQKIKYLELIDTYKSLDGHSCWREIRLPETVNPAKLDQLGVYWTITENAAESYWAKNHKNGFTCLYKGVIDLNVMDWSATMFARMDPILGDDEQEITFLKHSKLLIEEVLFYPFYELRKMKKVEINAYRRL